MAKFALGMLLAAAGFGLMIVAANHVVNQPGTLVSPMWLVGSLLLLTLGELALSPVGLSSMTKLAPERMQGQIMGLFFASIAVGNLVAAFLVAMSPLIPLMTYPTYLPPWRYFWW